MGSTMGSTNPSLREDGRPSEPGQHQAVGVMEETPQALQLLGVLGLTSWEAQPMAGVDL